MPSGNKADILEGRRRRARGGNGVLEHGYNDICKNRTEQTNIKNSSPTNFR